MVFTINHNYHISQLLHVTILNDTFQNCHIHQYYILFNKCHMPHATCHPNPGSSLSSLHRSQSKKRRRKHCELLGHGDNSQEDVEEEEEEEGLLLYIQMQMCQQRSLKEWLGDNTGFRSPNLIYDIFDQLVIAVEYVHKNGLMHRDLKVNT